jgi:hypothetical protein
MTALPFDPETVTLASGGHTSPEQGMCVMEMASLLAGEPFGDHPECVSPVIGEFLRTWNDGMSETDRQRLRPYAATVIGTRTTGADEETRAWMACDWLVRVQTPAWLRLAGLDAEARSLESLARISDATLARAAQPTIDAASDRAAAAWAAAWAAARAAAGGAAWAARDAARDAAGAAAWAAAWAAARAAAGGAARDAAGAARDAAGAAALADAWAARAARDAALAALRLTVEALQVSAFGLLDAMIAVGRPDATTLNGRPLIGYTWRSSPSYAATPQQSGRRPMMPETTVTYGPWPGRKEMDE